MDGIISFLKGIGDAIVAVFNFIVSFFSDVIYVIKLTGSILAQIPSFFNWLPDEIVALLLILFAIVVLYKILGREG